MLPQIIASTQNRLQTFALNKGLQSESIALVFGNNVDILQLQLLEQQFSLGNFTALPTVEILSSTELNGALGAYVTELDRIFISQELLASGSEEEIIAVILEEIGHAIDQRINLVDSIGDEGYIFSNLVTGVDLTAQQLALAQQENDQIEIIVDGQTVIAEAATIVVDTLVDENDGVGVGNGTSLREALANATNGDTINFDNSLIGQTITLTLGELAIANSVTIDGDIGNDGLPDITVSGNNSSRVFNIDDGTGTVQTVNIDGLTITGGSTSGNGGGIENREDLNLSNSTVSGNSANIGGGINHNNGTASISNSTFSKNNGGGISNRFIRTSISISNSTLSNNNGEGIFN